MATCENCWKAFEAGYGEAEKSYLATIESRDAELATLAAEATKLREAALNHRCAWHKKYTSSFQQLQPCDGGGYCLAARSIIAEAEGRIIRAAALGTTEASNG